jgi:hypothetical protein
LLSFSFNDAVSIGTEKDKKRAETQKMTVLRPVAVYRRRDHMHNETISNMVKLTCFRILRNMESNGEHTEGV